ncbi:MAG TPA: 2-amino-4-hydroxy-6-hydroxymethyldihydropteridine diphosphokinase [Jatrophihabitans sp.]|jgi:2-amino-4-hydroxy-6-hydroxymethyldihydropteridine diphosphokinase|nr:2-amino-4-hydroxy-6-hydroxymethyldihydropteridine diphosphokinase [Jatrophihabitans sp.]
MSRAVLSIGSNLDDRLAALCGAVDAFRPWLVAVSPVYETPPWGPVAQEDYLNAVLIVSDAEAGARDWLRRAQDAEQRAGRTRELRWGPRTLDVDVITVDDEVSSAAELTLPHPRAVERAFVLVPWLAADPQATLAGRPLADWLDRLPQDDVAGVRRLEIAGPKGGAAEVGSAFRWWVGRRT